MIARIVMVASCFAFATAVAGACAEPGSPNPELPDPPEGADLVLAVGDLEVYKVFDGELCAGTLRRTELHIDGLAELFDMEPPRARVFLYDESDTIDELCGLPASTRGCAPSWGAYAMAASVRHELVHVFVQNATGQVRTHKWLEESVAVRFDGDHAPSIPIDDSIDGLLDRGSALFVAWAVDRFGVDAILRAHVATSEAETDTEVGTALAEALGFASIVELFAEYEATRAFAYPPLPQTTKVFTSDEIFDGVTLDGSCAGPYTEGPTDGTLSTFVRIEVAEAGEYAQVGLRALPLATLEPVLQPTEPLFEDLDSGDLRAEWCAYGHEPPHMVFARAGQYEVRTEHDVNEDFPTPVSVRPTGNEVCEPY